MRSMRISGGGELPLVWGITSRGNDKRRRRRTAFTLVEVVLALAIAGLLMGGLMLGYVQVLRRAEWSAHSLAAHAMAVRGLEQARAAKWDTLAVPAVDQLVAGNFGPVVEVLDIPISGDNLALATNYTGIVGISVDPPLKLVRVDCVWSFYSGEVFTNTVVTYRAPDQ